METCPQYMEFTSDIYKREDRRNFVCSPPIKGQESQDADIVIYDKDKDFTISVDIMHSGCDHTIWEGKKLHGYPVRTFLRGNVVYADGEFTGTPGMGQFVKRSQKKLR